MSYGPDYNPHTEQEEAANILKVWQGPNSKQRSRMGSRYSRKIDVPRNRKRNKAARKARRRNR